MHNFREWRMSVAYAACAFESRWTLRSLQQVDAELHGRMLVQQGLFSQACVTGSDRDIATQGAAMCRGWAKAIEAMEAVQKPQNAALHGFDAVSGTRVVISEQKAVAGTLNGSDIFLTPDDVAVLVARSSLVGDVLRQWPGAEIVAVREAAQ